jgi:drug/metabolite transporter (DMT)-like permease
MPFGLLAGFGAALAWGTLDVFTALASRVVGSLRVTAGMQIVGAIEFAALGLLTGAVLPLDAASIAVAATLGLIGAGAYLAYFTGLQIGPISVVSGMVAAYGGLTVVLAVVIRGETLTIVQAFGAAIATVGVILTGVAFEGGLRGTRFAGPGVVFAVIALVLFSAMSIVTDIALETIAWLPLLIMARGCNALLSIGILVVLARAGRRMAALPTDGPGWSRRTVVLALVAAGTLDVLGLISFVVGLETAPTWMVGLASSFGPAVTIVAAVAFLGERLKPIQWVGLGGILVGMVAIGLPAPA